MLAQFAALKKNNPYFKIIIAIGKSPLFYLHSAPGVSKYEKYDANIKKRAFE